jgi:hypothetical protein
LHPGGWLCNSMGDHAIGKGFLWWNESDHGEVYLRQCTPRGLPRQWFREKSNFWTIQHDRLHVSILGNTDLVPFWYCLPLQGIQHLPFAHNHLCEQLSKAVVASVNNAVLFVKVNLETAITACQHVVFLSWLKRKFLWSDLQL